MGCGCQSPNSLRISRVETTVSAITLTTFIRNDPLMIVSLWEDDGELCLWWGQRTLYCLLFFYVLLCFSVCF
jgi:hypothetical protein